MNDPNLQPDPLLRCDYSGEAHPPSEMVQIDGQNIAITHKDAYVQFLQQGGDPARLRRERISAGGLGLFSVLGQSWKLFISTLAVLLPVYFTVQLPCIFFSSWIDANVFDPDDVLKSVKLAYKLEWWVGIIATAGCYRVLSVAWAGGTPHYGEALGYGLAKWGRMWLLNLFRGLILVVGLLLLVIPGVVFYVRTSMAECYATDGGLPATQSVSASFDLSRGHFWRTAGYFLLIGSGLLLPSFILPMIVAFLPEEVQHWTIDAAVECVASVGLLFLIVVTFVYYKALIAAGVKSDASLVSAP